MAKMATGTKVLLGVGVAGIAGYALWKLFPEAFGGGDDQKTQDLPAGDTLLVDVPPAGATMTQQEGMYAPSAFGGGTGGRGDKKGGTGGEPESPTFESRREEPAPTFQSVYIPPYAE